MCRACTHNERNKSLPWLDAEVRKFIASDESGQLNDDDGPPQPYSVAWALIERLILLREGFIKHDGKFDWEKVNREGKTHQVLP